MAKETRMLKCAETGKMFPYRGVGRPPHYCPEVQKRRKAEQQKKARANAKAKRKAA